MKDEILDFSKGADIIDMSAPVDTQLEWAMIHAYELGFKNATKEAFVKDHEDNVIDEVDE